MFKNFANEIEILFSNKIKRIRSDKRIEYYFSLFNEFYKQHWIVHEITAPYSPEMNGKADRKNITLIELVVAITLNSGVASHWWEKFCLLFDISCIEFPSHKVRSFLMRY